jgi:SAM-dependent methyltransferase
MSDFDSYAHDYESALDRGIAISGENAAFFSRERIAWLARCLERLRFTPTTVLDYGCGTGTATPFFFELLGARSVTGVELSARSLEVARHAHRNMSVEYRLTNDYTPEGTIDLAFCNGVFHHVPENDRQATVRYIADCLRPRGIFALWENNPWSPGARYVMSRIPFDRDAVMVWPNQARTLVGSAGLRAIRTDYRFIFPKILRVFRCVEPLLTHVPLGAQYQVLSQKQ